MGQTHHTLAVFIGRFQPFHAGHHAVIAATAGKADSLLVLIGSAYRPRSWKNPFSYQERCDFLKQGHADIALPVSTLPLLDTIYSDPEWAANVRTAVYMHMRAKGLDPATTDIALTGFDKDKSSQYLRWFPEWRMLPAAPHTHEGKILNATEMREMLFFGQPDAKFGPANRAAVQRWMAAHPEDVAQIRAEAGYVKAYKKRIAKAETALGYPISISTADAVVLHAGHVLLVQRKAFPGKGLWALPGGHIERDENALTAVLRELFEETGLEIPPDTLESCLTKRQVFDDPERSEAGWVRTEAFVFDLPPSPERPALRAGSDAGAARWVPLAALTPDRIFEDHFDIIQTLVPAMPHAYAALLMALTLKI